jgi:uncharacterized protein (TIGR02598 family)
VKTRRHGFSLVEVVLALGVVGFALLAILGVAPVGLKSANESIDATRTSIIAADIESRIRASITTADFPSAAPTTRNFVPWYYNRDGILVSSAATGFYRVDATLGSSWANSLPNTDEHYLRPVSAIVRWPVDQTTGNPISNNSGTFTFFVRKP